MQAIASPQNAFSRNGRGHPSRIRCDGLPFPAATFRVSVNKCKETRDFRAPVYSWFTEGGANPPDCTADRDAIVCNEVFRIAASFGKLGRLSGGESVPLDRSSVWATQSATCSQSTSPAPGALPASSGLIF
jgi:hypothetical protein